MPLISEDVFGSSAGAFQNKLAHGNALFGRNHFEQPIFCWGCPQIQAPGAVSPRCGGSHIRTHIVHPLDVSVKGLERRL